MRMSNLFKIMRQYLLQKRNYDHLLSVICRIIRLTNKSEFNNTKIKSI